MNEEDNLDPDHDNNPQRNIPRGSDLPHPTRNVHAKSRLNPKFDDPRLDQASIPSS
ncbi:uncharacterized protein LOC143212974 isoform X4 [Lasioglossum baleicum]|uniref:uncharacterized protein LOC143212974 isoform X4 n=1 Tax=Lasioglossum baleicum TaxID=434251 RepID=UPI003FCDF7B2